MLSLLGIRSIARQDELALTSAALQAAAECRVIDPVLKLKKHL
jgi:hypothetical protein